MCSSSSSAACTDNAPEVIAGQNVQIGDKGPSALLARPCEPRNHAVFFRQRVSVPSLCHRFGHDRLVSVPRGLAERPLRDVVWAEGSLGRGHSTSTGAVHALGDRMAVPGRATCPRLEWFAPGRAERPRRETVVARRIRPWRWVGLSGDRLEGAVEDSGPAAPALTHAQAGAHGLHTALRPLHARLRRPRQRRGRRSSVPLRG